ncbi:MAG: ATP-binding protein [Cyclobacteriaceae bacterium]
MEDKNLLEKGQIEVSKKTLLHISEGIYRTEGSAIKELINNSFDANAKKVIVNTNYPQFDIITIQDDGDGMTETEFLRIVKGGIGDSLKAKSHIDNNRPVIGRLGIGILSIAQICRSFTIISHHEESKTAFRGRMMFRTDVDNVAKGENKAMYDIGIWELEDRIDYDDSKKGVLIFTKDLRQSFLKRFKESKKINHERNTTPIDFGKLINLYYENNFKITKELGPYFELIWELSNLLPIPYFNGTPIRPEVSKTIKQITKKEDLNEFKYVSGQAFLSAKNTELELYEFEVIFDDIKIFRPIKMPFPINNRYGDIQETQLYYFEYDNIVRKRRLNFFGYFFAQEMAIKPRDLKGLQIRIKNVGIGIHDATFLKYDKIESPRDNWLTGEIYVENGLESALNIDRDSFNENDEHYYILREQVHKMLSELVFPSISSLQRKRNKIKREEKLIHNSQFYQTKIYGVFRKYFINYEITFEENLDNHIEIFPDESLIFIPIELITANNKVKMDIFSKSAISILDNLRLLFTSSIAIEDGFQAISKSILE